MAKPCQSIAPLVHRDNGEVRDEAGNRWLAIEDLRSMRPFLMSVVSDVDLWMFVSSAHGLTCGRGVAERCLFPYETDDRLHRVGEQVGPWTALRVTRPGAEPTLWRPFHPDDTATRRSLYKSELGDRVLFEATHPELGLVFRYRWAACDAYGFVRTSELALAPSAPGGCEVELLDGLRAIMPAGVHLRTQQSASALVNAYRRSERIPDNPRVAVYALSAMIVDRAEPAEALRANAVWSVGLDDAEVFLDEAQAERFLRGAPLEPQDELRGRPGAYLLGAALSLEPGAAARWHIVADVDRSQAQVVELLGAAARDDAAARLEAAIEADAASLRAKLAAADGCQATGDPVQDAHHLANALFNCMRGGLFVDDYRAPARDLRDFIAARNAPVAREHAALLSSLEDPVDCPAFVERARETGDPELLRLALEYLPVTFSRRHGDPSRPWNAFSIRVRDDAGSPVFYYEGNWRDIFQNWEALLYAYPAFLPNVVAKFVNASTVDGFNPYRLTREGVDWEVPEPDDPWSYIGYWGDHQIVYLTRLLEAMEAHWPGALDAWLAQPVFSYADVPYRLADHARTIADPRDTVRFDEARAAAIETRVERLGADGRLLVDERGEVYHATLAEKLIVPVLAKLGQLVIDGGIWMNTQRPEWNDANNALAGYGLSMVTLYQLRRHLDFLRRCFERAGGEAALSVEVASWLRRVTAILRDAAPELDEMSDARRRELLDALGEAAADYRARVYADGLHPGGPRPLDELADLCRAALPVLDHAVRANRRADGLYNAYNLLHVSPGRPDARIETMYEMLEGQVAILGAGVLDAREAVEVLDALFASDMYREDQRSFMLYPDRPLPRFLEKNVVPTARVDEDELLQRVLDQGARSVAARDGRGEVRFAADLRNAAALRAALDALAEAPGWAAPVAEGRAALLETFELTFHHHAFTGRSGTMFAYEGLGSIYWHMVSKLLLAVQENLRWAEERGDDEEVRAALLARYRRVKDGLGPAKTPQVYGAFPTDPYSHTPRHAGAQQPGMTGQVKEELLTRRGELGLAVDDGQLGFGWGSLSADDFRAAGDLEFTVAGVPVRYRLADVDAPEITVDLDNERRAVPGLALDRELSRRVFLRDDAVRQIEVKLPRRG